MIIPDQPCAALDALLVIPVPFGHCLAGLMCESVENWQHVRLDCKICRLAFVNAELFMITKQSSEYGRSKAEAGLCCDGRTGLNRIRHEAAPIDFLRPRQRDGGSHRPGSC